MAHFHTTALYNRQFDRIEKVQWPRPSVSKAHVVSGGFLKKKNQIKEKIAKLNTSLNKWLLIDKYIQSNQIE